MLGIWTRYTCTKITAALWIALRRNPVLLRFYYQPFGYSETTWHGASRWARSWRVLRMTPMSTSGRAPLTCQAKASRRTALEQPSVAASSHSRCGPDSGHMTRIRGNGCTLYIGTQISTLSRWLMCPEHRNSCESAGMVASPRLDVSHFAAEQAQHSA